MTRSRTALDAVTVSGARTAHADRSARSRRLARSDRPRRPARAIRSAAPFAALAALALTVAGCADPVSVSGASGGAAAGGDAPAGGSESTGVVYNMSPDQDRIRAEADPELAAAVPEEISADGKLTVGTTAQGSVPLTFMADDNETPIGSELDTAQLVADKLGLELDIQVTSWENWPLKLETGEYEVVHSNVGVNDERLERYDFATYRGAFMGFEARAGSGLQIDDHQDISGQRISVSAGTNQENILLAWNEQLEAEGEEPASLHYYANDADTILALSSGRLDLHFGPYPTATYRENTRDDLEVVGKVNAGWPDETLVAATMLRGDGLAPVYTDALNALMEEGTYDQVLERWGLEEEAVPEAQLHTKENYAD